MKIVDEPAFSGDLFHPHEKAHYLFVTQVMSEERAYDEVYRRWRLIGEGIAGHKFYGAVALREFTRRLCCKRIQVDAGEC